MQLEVWPLYFDVIDSIENKERKQCTENVAFLETTKTCIDFSILSPEIPQQLSCLIR